jgi:hypothetical protein
VDPVRSYHPAVSGRASRGRPEPCLAIERLLVVHAADGVLAVVAEGERRLLRLKGCTLCSLSHGQNGGQTAGPDCQQELGVPVDHCHRDELPAALRALVGDQTPCILALAGGEPALLIGPLGLERCQGSAADLKGRLRAQAAMRGLSLPLG